MHSFAPFSWNPFSKRNFVKFCEFKICDFLRNCCYFFRKFSQNILLNSLQENSAGPEFFLTKFFRIFAESKNPTPTRRQKPHSHTAAPCRTGAVCSTFGIPPVVLLELASSFARPAAALRDLRFFSGFFSSSSSAPPAQITADTPRWTPNVRETLGGRFSY